MYPIKNVQLYNGSVKTIATLFALSEVGSSILMFCLLFPWFFYMTEPNKMITKSSMLAHIDVTGLFLDSTMY